MTKLVGAKRIVLGCVVAGTVAGAATIAGCGGDDTTGSPDASSSSSSSSSGGSSSSGSSSSGGGSSSSSGGGSSSSSSGGTSSSSSSGGSSSSSSGGSDAGDGGDATLTGDADAGGDAADADAAPPCVTSMIATGDGGSVNVGDGGTGQLFYSFDNGLVPAGWAAATVHDPTDAGIVGTLSVSTSEGHTCAGALQLTIPFSASGQQVDMVLNTNGPTYTGTQFHAWIKVEVPPAADGGPSPTVANEFLQGNGQAYSQWRIHGADAGLYSQQDFLNFYPPAFASWQEVVIPVTGGSDAGVVTFDLAQLGANLLYNVTDAGAPPTTAVLLLDDVWLE
jgi:hypothetical protein